MYKPFSPYSDYTGDVQDPIRVRVLKLFERGWRFINLGSALCAHFKRFGHLFTEQGPRLGRGRWGLWIQNRVIHWRKAQRAVSRLELCVQPPPPPTTDHHQLPPPPQSPVSIIEYVTAVCYFQSMWFITFRVEFVLSPPPNHGQSSFSRYGVTVCHLHMLGYFPLQPQLICRQRLQS